MINQADEKKKEVDAEAQLKETLANVTKLLEAMVVKMTIIIGGFQVLVLNEQQKEQLSVKYGQQEIFIEVDLAFKEITTIRALGLEIQTRESFMAFEMVAKKMMDNMKKIQDFTKKDLSEIPNVDV